MQLEISLKASINMEKKKKFKSLGSQQEITKKWKMIQQWPYS